MGGEQHKPQGERFDKQILAGWSCARCVGPLVDLHWSGGSGHGEPSPRTACAPRAWHQGFSLLSFPCRKEIPPLPCSAWPQPVILPATPIIIPSCHLNF